MRDCQCEDGIFSSHFSSDLPGTEWLHHFGSSALLTRVPRPPVFVIPGKTTSQGSQGIEFSRSSSGLVRGHSWPTASDRPLEFSAEGMGQRQRPSPRGASGVSSARALASRCSVTRASTGRRLQSPQSGRSAGRGVQQDHQVAVSSGSSWGRRIRKERVGGRTQESASAGRGPTSGGANRSNVRRNGRYSEGARSVGTRVEGRQREGVVGGRRTSVEIAPRGRAAHATSSRPSNGGATLATAAFTSKVAQQ